MSTQDGFVVSSPGSSGAAPWFYVFCEPYVYYKNRCNHRDGTRLCGPCSDACVLGRLGGKAGCQSFLAVSCAFWWFVVVVNAPLVPPEISVSRGGAGEGRGVAVDGISAHVPSPPHPLASFFFAAFLEKYGGKNAM